MSSVGPYLREMRVQRGVSFEEIARSTRVAPSFLAALERDDFVQLPPPVFTRGFIRAYCQTLNEPAEEALALYARRPDAPRTERRLPRARAAGLAATGSEGRGRSAVFVSFVLLVALGVALFVVRIALQAGREPPARQAETMTGPSAPSRPPAPRGAPPSSAVSHGLDAAPDTPRSSEPRSPAPASTSPVGAAPPAPTLAAVPLVGTVASPYRLVAKTTEPTWLRVRTEDGHLTEENIPAGEVREWVSNRPFVLTVGNAGGLTLELNGRPVPALGASGVVIRDLMLPRERS
jgi:cytoskeletal protein RodZ